LPFPLSPKSHPQPAVLARRTANQIRADFVNGLLGEVLETSRGVFDPAFAAPVFSVIANLLGNPGKENHATRESSKAIAIILAKTSRTAAGNTYLALAPQPSPMVNT
jgi:hypothetical protein